MVHCFPIRCGQAGLLFEKDSYRWIFFVAIQQILSL